MYVLLEFWQKNHDDPYYEPIIVVHDKCKVHSDVSTKQYSYD